MQELSETLGRQPSRSVRELPRALLFAALRAAGDALELGDSVLATAERLIRYIPAGASAPTSTILLTRLAEERGMTERAVRYHISRLVELGLARNETLGGGGRRLTKDERGRIAELFGISFQPLLERAEELQRQAQAAAAARRACDVLRKTISMRRRQVRVLLPRLPEGSPVHQVWAALPRRLGGIGHEDLQELAWRCQAILEEAELALQATPPVEASAAPSESVEYSGEAEKNFRPTTYTSEPTTPHPVGTGRAGYARQGERSGLASSSSPKLCGVEHVTLAMALHAAPEEWHGAFTRKGSLSWETLSRMAQARLQPLGINRQAWLIAETAIGSRGAAILVLIADANWSARGGQIRKPGAWVRAMAERAAAGQAYLHRSVFGILKRPAGGAQ
jgi:replication initiation protein RepC